VFWRQSLKAAWVRCYVGDRQTATRTCRPSLSGLELLRQGVTLRRRGLALRHSLRQRRRRRLRAAAALPSACPSWAELLPACGGQELRACQAPAPHAWPVACMRMWLAAGVGSAHARTPPLGISLCSYLRAPWQHGVLQPHAG